MNFRTMEGITAFIKSSKVILWYDESHRLWPKWNYDETAVFFSLYVNIKKKFSTIYRRYLSWNKILFFSIEPKF